MRGWWFSSQPEASAGPPWLPHPNSPSRPQTHEISSWIRREIESETLGFKGNISVQLPGWHIRRNRLAHDIAIAAVRQKDPKLHRIPPRPNRNRSERHPCPSAVLHQPTFCPHSTLPGPVNVAEMGIVAWNMVCDSRRIDIKHKGLRALFERGDARHLPTGLVPRIRRVLSDLGRGSRAAEPGYARLARFTLRCSRASPCSSGKTRAGTKRPGRDGGAPRLGGRPSWPPCGLEARTPQGGERRATQHRDLL